MKDQVMMDGYTIRQKTSGPPHETAVSVVTVDFAILSNDTHSVKHEDFLNDVRAFLMLRNSDQFPPIS